MDRPDPLPSDSVAWSFFLKQFNEFVYQRNGMPLPNQSPFVERKRVEAAYGQRWADFAEWVKSVDPARRMVNPFFAELLPA